MPFAEPAPAVAISSLIVVVPKSARANRKQPDALHPAGRSTIHSADARSQLAQAAEVVALLPVERSAIVSMNLPAVYWTVASITSPGRTRKTLTDPAGYISYQAAYWGVV